MRLQKTCLPYMVIVAVVMSIYSMFLVHLTQSFRSSLSAESYSGGPDPWSNTGHAAEAEQAPCRCTAESVAGLEARREVVIGLSFPYKYFNSNHWFHISEYYVSRHAHVAPKLPRNATVYIVAPHEYFVPNLIPMTFFLLLLAFTDGTTTTAEVLPRRALAQLAVAGDVLALDNDGVESYVYDRSLPAFHRTQRYHPGERRANQSRRGLTASLNGGGEVGEGARLPTGGAPEEAFAGTTEEDGGGGAERRRHRHRQLLGREEEEEEAPQGSGRVGSAFNGRHLLRAKGESDRGVGEGAWHLSSSSKGWSGKEREGQQDVDVTSPRAGLGNGSGGDGGSGAGFSRENARHTRPHEGNERIERASAVTAPGMTGSVTTAAAERETVRRLPGIEASLRRSSSSRSRDRTSSDTNEQPWRETGNAAAAAAVKVVVAAENPSTAALDAARILTARADGNSAADPAAKSPPLDRTAAGAAATAEPGTNITEDRGAGPQPKEHHDKSNGHHSHHHASVEEKEEAVGAEFFPIPTLAEQQQPSGRPCACARYIGEFGAAPVERGYWFREDKAENARARIDALCGDIYRRRRDDGQPTQAEEGERSGRQRLVIYQRNHDRRLLDLDDNVAVFRELLGPKWEVVPIVHDNAHEPCWLYSQLMDADMLLTPHGFQSMLLLFLPPGATILEVFPYKYWKEGYAPLAREWGVQHEHIMSRPVSWSKRLALFLMPLERCMKSIHCRKWSRAADVRLEEHHLRQIAKAAKKASEKKRDFLPATGAAP